MTQVPFSVDRLTVACEELAIEAFTVTDLSKAISLNASRIKQQLKKTFRDAFQLPQTPPTTLRVQAVRRSLQRVRYSDLTDFTVQTPVGFHPKPEYFLLYVGSLVNQHASLVQSIPQTLDKAKAILAGVVNEPEQLTEKVVTSYNKTFLTTLQGMNQRVQDLWQENRAYFDRDHDNSAAFTDVYQNLAEYTDIETKLNEANSAHWKHAGPRRIKAKVDDLSEIAQRVIDLIDHHRDTATKQQVEYLSQLIGESAKLVEYYAAITTVMTDTTEAMYTTDQKILRAL